MFSIPPAMFEFYFILYLSFTIEFVVFRYLHIPYLLFFYMLLIEFVKYLTNSIYQKYCVH